MTILTAQFVGALLMNAGFACLLGRAIAKRDKGEIIGFLILVVGNFIVWFPR